MRSFASDYEIGKRAERALLPTFNNYFKTDFISTGRYDSLDFVSSTHNLELKSRTNALNQYPTTLLPYSKVQHAEASQRKTIFAFNFTDGLTYIEYDKALFLTFGTNEFQRPARADHTDRNQLYIYIPVKHLIKLE